MKKITLICVMAVVCLLCCKANAQNIVPFQIGERVPDLPLTNLINYKDSTATLSSFGNKIIILDFWGTYCTSCIKMFPFQQALQEKLHDKIQFLLVTQDDRQKAIKFLEAWRISNNQTFSIPIVTEDRVLARLFRYRFIPHYIWIDPTGEIMGQTSEAYVNAETINHLWKASTEKRAALIGNNYPKEALTYPALLAHMKTLINQLQNQN